MSWDPRGTAGGWHALGFHGSWAAMLHPWRSPVAVIVVEV
jgi:hypothetical protein